MLKQVFLDGVLVEPGMVLAWRTWWRGMSGRPPDPVLLDKFWDSADKYGISSDELISRMGGGP